MGKEGHTSRQLEELAINDHGLGLGLVARRLAALPLVSVYRSAKVQGQYMTVRTRRKTFSLLNLKSPVERGAQSSGLVSSGVG